MNHLNQWLPNLPTTVWMLAVGRLLSQVGTGFTLFYATIFFVNRVGLSAAAVGLALGLGAAVGMAGRIVGGTLADSPDWGRRKILILSSIISAFGSLVLSITVNLPFFTAGSVIMGLGIGLYWPAMEASIADLAGEDNRNEAYALNRLADNLGLGMGVVCGGWVITTTGAFRVLYMVDGLSYLIFGVIVYFSIHETTHPVSQPFTPRGNWRFALADGQLLTFGLVNCVLTLYIAQVQTVLPLYFTNFVHTNIRGLPSGFSASTISGLITGHILLSSLFQLPVARWLGRYPHPRSLMLSAGLWGIGFALVGFTGLNSQFPVVIAALALTTISFASIIYLPTASAFVAEMAPQSLRGTYLAINSLCWAVGYVVGSPVGGWALDQPQPVPHLFWFTLTGTALIMMPILNYLNQLPSPR